MSIYSALAQSHWDSALKTFRQLRQDRAAPEMDAEVLARHEQFLRYHLWILARCEWQAPEVEGTLDAFVVLAARLSSSEDEVRSEGRRSAYEMLIEGGVKGEGAFAALALLPEEDAAGSFDLYQSHPSLRPTLFDLWREQGRQVPHDLLSPSALNGSDEALLRAALMYAASEPSIGVEFFQPYYQTPSYTEQGVGVLAAALWGGMQRGDKNLRPVLRRCINKETEPKARFHLARLGALCADPEILPDLLKILKERPEEGACLLALHGTRETVDLLVESLSAAPLMSSVAQVWGRLSGRPLPMKSRLQVVGREDGGHGSMPDAEVARSWWQQRRETLKTGQRLLYGEPCSLAGLRLLAEKKAGEVGRDFLDLLALEIGRPLGVSAGAEILKRRNILRRIASPGT